MIRPSSGLRPLAVAIGGGCAAEKRYALEVMLSGILGYECEWSFLPAARECVISFPRGYRIRIEDGFFDGGAGEEYVDRSRLPGEPIRISHPMTDGDVVAFYGKPEIADEAHETRIGLDIVATAFFLLSRWEEAVIEARDQWGRIPDDAHYVRRNRLDERPLVNEYAEWIARLAEERGEQVPARPASFELLPTHDIDRLYLQGTAEITKQALAHRMPKRFATWMLYRILRVDQAAVFDRIMTLSENAGKKSRFYCMSGGIFPYDLYYRLGDSAVQAIIRRIIERGHILGFHPSWVAAKDDRIWRQERMTLEKHVGRHVDETRQHYLRTSVPETIDILASNGISVDSSFGFSRKNGFRCGTGSSYPLFDLKRRMPTTVMERPLILMDAAIRKGEHRTSDKAAALRLIETCRKYSMPCTILFHNHLLDPVPWNDLPDLYEGIMTGEARARGI